MDATDVVAPSVFLAAVLGIEPLAHLAPGLEDGLAHGGCLDDLASPWVAHAPGRHVLGREGREAAQLYLVALGERLGDAVEDHRHGGPDLALAEARILAGDAADELGFDHPGVSPLRASRPAAVIA